MSDAGALGRDGGHSLRIGDRVLWLFGDSFTDQGLVSMTAAWSDAVDPMSLRDATDGSGAPTQVLPWSSDEEAFNKAHSQLPTCCHRREGCVTTEPYCHCAAGVDCTQRLALWPGDGAIEKNGQLTFYFDRQWVGVAPYEFRPAGVGIATIARNAAVAVRETGLLFSASEPPFSRGLAWTDHDGTFFYAYAPTNHRGCAVDVLLARVPIGSMKHRDRYRFWNGHSWSERLLDAAPVASEVAGGLGSVSWNCYLGKFLSVWSDICTGGDHLALRTAPTPQGPWSAAAEIDIRPWGAEADAYYGWAHPEFGDGKEIVVSYFQPHGAIEGQLRLLRLTLP